jgi:spore coat polysaccharide biosynthesis protein SpsF
MGSTRLPGKVMMDLAGKPMLTQQLARLRRCRFVDEIIVATSTAPADDAIADLVSREGIRCYRGSEYDVLGRYLGAARECGAEIVVRVTADCPLIDSAVTDRVVEELQLRASECDYVSNVLERTFPRGLDTEALFFDVLARMDRLASSSAAREHVTYFLCQEHPLLFRRFSVTDREDNSDLRWTVDTPQDLELVRRIYGALGLGDNPLPYRQVISYMRAHPELSMLNAGVAQKPF